MHHYVVKRSFPDFDRMIEIHNWCREAFGKEDYVRWNVNFARGTEDYVEFDFRDDADAAWFLLKWDKDCISRDKQFELGILSWSDI